MRLWNTATEVVGPWRAHRCDLGGAERGRVSGGVRILDKTVACGTPRPSVSGPWRGTPEAASLALSADRSRVASGSMTGGRLWTPRPESVPDLEGHTDKVTCGVSADGSRVVSGSGKTVRLWTPRPESVSDPGGALSFNRLRRISCPTGRTTMEHNLSRVLLDAPAGATQLAECVIRGDTVCSHESNIVHIFTVRRSARASSGEGASAEPPQKRRRLH